MARLKANRKSSLKQPASPVAVALFLFGMGVGYGVREFVLAPHPTPASVPSIMVCFTPGKSCQSQLIDAINKARKSIVVQAYSFTDKDVANALVKASRRGVEVKAILDKSNAKDARSAKNILMENGVPVRFDYPSGIAHNKVMVIDDSVVTGSYNFSAAAYKSNAENILFVASPELAHMYRENWLKRWELSRSCGSVSGRNPESPEGGEPPD